MRNGVLIPLRDVSKDGILTDTLSSSLFSYKSCNIQRCRAKKGVFVEDIYESNRIKIRMKTQCVPL